MDWNDTSMDQNLKTVGSNVTTMDRDFTWDVFLASISYTSWPLLYRIKVTLQLSQYFYYPLLAAVGVPLNLVTILILSQGKCGLSKCVTWYLVAMAAADLMVVIFDLILMEIPIRYADQFRFLADVPVCNYHAVLLYAVTDCSVWFTVTFTFDRFVAICCQKFKTKYCTEKMAAAVLGTVTVLSGLKNIFWYFMLSGWYTLSTYRWFCMESWEASSSLVFAVLELLHYILNPCVAFVLILLLNALTVRHILVSSRARRRLQRPSSGERPRDLEMESRRKSIISMFIISGNFILLWALFMLFYIWQRLFYDGHLCLGPDMYLHSFVKELGIMLQLLSCCTNTGIYAITQTKFREHLKNMVKNAFTLIVKFIKP
uniref:probable G-protein coupled receptor 139 n=1 Tax=Pristiophorus japonicus TaxID=55135 RepID=UPI00398F89E4